MAFETWNMFAVAGGPNDSVLVINAARTRMPMERDEVLNLVAYLALLARLSDEEIRTAREAIEVAS